MNELLPCPFCGGRMVAPWPQASPALLNAGWIITCGNIDCQAEGPWDLGKSGAIAKWNERAPTTTIDAVTYPPGTTLTTGDTCPDYGSEDRADPLEDV